MSDHTLCLWLTKRPNGQLILSYCKPVKARIKGTRDEFDVYLSHGEPIGVQHLCQVAEKVVRRKLAPFETLPVLFKLIPNGESEFLV